MCVAFLIYKAHPRLLFLLAFNRDESLTRPTAPAHWWPDHPHVWGGRDQEAGGTWLGITKTGRFALLTNFREVGARVDAISRGVLPLDFLTGDASPLEYLQGVNGESFNGFNLIVGDLCSGHMAYTSNRGAQPQEIGGGVIGVTNGLLQDKWPKVVRGEQQLREMLQGGEFDNGEVPWERIFGEVLSNREQVTDPRQLPRTGWLPESEQILSATYIDPIRMPTGAYGTRSQMCIAVGADGGAEARERYLAEDGVWRENRFDFPMASDAGDALCRANL